MHLSLSIGMSVFAGSQRPSGARLQPSMGSSPASQGDEEVSGDMESDGEDGGERVGSKLYAKTPPPGDISPGPGAPDALPDLLMAKVRGWPWWPARPGTAAARSFVLEGWTHVHSCLLGVIQRAFTPARGVETSCACPGHKS
jgi:hypothetical protein